MFNLGIGLVIVWHRPEYAMAEVWFSCKCRIRTRADSNERWLWGLRVNKEPSACKEHLTVFPEGVVSNAS